MADKSYTDTIHDAPLLYHDNGDGTFSPVVWQGGASTGAGSPITVTLVDHSIASATGASQTLLAANAARKALTVLNPKWETTDWTIGPTGAAAVAGAVPGITLSPGDEWTPAKIPLNAITAIGTATHKLIVLEG